jgi:hypothetical protein
MSKFKHCDILIRALVCATKDFTQINTDPKYKEPKIDLCKDLIQYTTKSKVCDFSMYYYLHNYKDLKLNRSIQSN